MNQDTPTQLVLGVHLQDEARFSNFVVTAANSQLLENLQGEDSSRQFIYIWGNPGSGRTHLLQALCHQQAGCLPAPWADLLPAIGAYCLWHPAHRRSTPPRDLPGCCAPSP